MRITQLLLAFMLVVSCAAAANLKVTVVPINDTVYPNQNALFDVIVENRGTDPEDLRYVFSEDTAWSVITTPIYYQNSMKILPGEFTVTTIDIRPSDSILSGSRYNYTVKLKSNIDNFQENVGLSLFLKNPLRDYGYVPNVQVYAAVDSELDPRKPGTVTVELRNVNGLNISKVVVIMDTTLNPANDQRIEVPLAGFEKKRFALSLKYDPLQPPRKDFITVSSFIPEKNLSLDSTQAELQILPYNEVTRDRQEKGEFMKSTITLTYANDGNVNKLERIRVPISLVKDLFTQTKPEAVVIKESGYRYYSWDYDLSPQETRMITITANYRPIFIVFVLIFAVVVLYFVFRSPIVVRKVVTQLQREEHEVSRVKVLLHIKNRSGRIIENVEVIDRVPHIAALENEFPVGTLQPQKVIRHEHKGTFVKWAIPSLESYEERIISYKMSSKLPVIGGLGLRTAIVKYRNKMGGTSKVYSNKI